MVFKRTILGTRLSVFLSSGSIGIGAWNSMELRGAALLANCAFIGQRARMCVSHAPDVGCLKGAVLTLSQKKSTQKDPQILWRPQSGGYLEVQLLRKRALLLSRDKRPQQTLSSESKNAPHNGEEPKIGPPLCLGGPKPDNNFCTRVRPFLTLLRLSPHALNLTAVARSSCSRGGNNEKDRRSQSASQRGERQALQWLKDWWVPVAWMDLFNCQNDCSYTL